MKHRDFDSTKYLTVNECLEISGFHNAYFRKLLKLGKIKGEKKFISDTKIERWLVERESLEDYLSRGSHTSRSDGRNKFLIYLSPEEFTELRSLLGEKKVDEYDLKRANVSKKI